MVLVLHRSWSSQTKQFTLTKQPFHMKKLAYYFSAALLSATVLFTACNKKKDDPAPADCSTSVYPSTSGTASVAFLNNNISDTDGDGIVDIAASAGNYLSLSASVTKGTNRPQKLRVYQSDCVNLKGTQVAFPGQSGVTSDGTIDLRNTDEVQIRTIAYTVPSGYSSLYLTFEVDESGSKYTYKRLHLKISGSGVIDTWTGVSLGAQLNTLASRLVSGTGQTFIACDAAANIEYIDVTYAASGSPTVKSYLCSNPARFVAPISLLSSSASCGEDGTLSTDGGRSTYFKASSANFDAATNADLTALTVSSSNTQYVEITGLNTVYEFLNSDGKKGLIKVTAGTLGTTNGSVTLSVKVQR